MKRIWTLLILVAVAVNSFAQSGDKKIDKIKSAIDPASIAGLYAYDAQALTKTLNIKRASKRDAITQLVNDYNSELEQLKSENLASLISLGADVKSIVQEKEFLKLFTARSNFKDQIEGIKSQRDRLHNSFEVELVQELKKRKQRKWFKYKEAQALAQNQGFAVGDLFSVIGM